MNDRDAFFRMIAANPDDDTVRLVFADWLEEHNKIREAKIIRQGIKSPELGFWRSGLFEDVKLLFRRGVACKAKCKESAWLKLGHIVIAEHPMIQVVSLSQKMPQRRTVRSFFGTEYTNGRNGFLYGWGVHVEGTQNPARVNRNLFKFITDENSVWYESNSLAHRALSDACIKYARERGEVHV